MLFSILKTSRLKSLAEKVHFCLYLLDRCVIKIELRVSDSPYSSAFSLLDSLPVTIGVFISGLQNGQNLGSLASQGNFLANVISVSFRMI